MDDENLYQDETQQEQPFQSKYQSILHTEEYANGDGMRGQTENLSYDGGMPHTRREHSEDTICGLVSMILGILSVFLFAACVNVPIAIVAVIFGIMQIVRSRKRAMAIAGIVTGILSIIMGIALWVALVNGLTGENGILNQLLQDGQNRNGIENYLDEYEDFFEDYGDMFEEVPEWRYREHNHGDSHGNSHGQM